MLIRPEVVAHDAEERRYQALSHLIVQKEVQLVLAHFLEKGIDCLLMKGFPLGFLIYKNPSDRLISDVDLIIKNEDRRRVSELMRSLGFTLPPVVSGKYVNQEFVAWRKAEPGVNVVLDFHVKLSSSIFFGDMLNFETLAEKSICVPALGEHVKTLGFVHALFLACIHLVSHHPNDARKAWFRDIHLLIERMTPEMFDDFLDLAEEKKIRKICAEVIFLTQKTFGTRIADAALKRLQDFSGCKELSSAYLGPRTRVKDLWLNFNSIRGFYHQMEYLGELLFPSPDYMRSRHGAAPTALLPWLYFRRFLNGILKCTRSS